MKTASVLVALVVCLVGGVALGFGLGSPEGVKAVSPLELARLDEPATRAPAPLEQAPLDDRGLDADRNADAVAALERRIAELQGALAAQKAAGEELTAEAEARVAEMQAQLEDERMHRLNMVEEAIERRRLEPRDKGTLGTLLDQPSVSSYTLPASTVSPNALGKYMVFIEAFQHVRMDQPNLPTPEEE